MIWQLSLIEKVWSDTFESFEANGGKNAKWLEIDNTIAMLLSFILIKQLEIFAFEYFFGKLS